MAMIGNDANESEAEKNERAGLGNDVDAKSGNHKIIRVSARSSIDEEESILVVVVYSVYGAAERALLMKEVLITHTCVCKFEMVEMTGQ